MKRYLTLIATVICTTHITLGQSHLFTSYRVPLYKGQKAKLRLKGNKLAEMFRTTIRDTYYSKSDMVVWHGMGGQNFAGHYCFVYWGCGSECQDAAVVDLKTGIVYPALTASLGYKFQRDSRLVIVNPDETTDSCASCASEYWVWNERAKAFRKIK